MKFYFYSLYDRVDSIPYVTRIRNNEWSNVFISYSLFYKIHARTAVAQLHVSTGTAAVFTRITNYFRSIL